MSESNPTQPNPEELSAQHNEEATILAEWAQEEGVDQSTLDSLIRDREDARQADGSAEYDAEQAAARGRQALEDERTAQQDNDWRNNPESNQ